MSTHQHLDLLEQGADAWNKWRRKNPDIAPNFRGADLRKKSLRNYDLSRCDLSHTDARDTSFRKADLRDANLSSAKLYRAFFSSSTMAGATLRHATLYETVFANVDLSDVKDLGDCTHKGPSVLDHRTLVRSRSLPLEFLQGCGLPDGLITEANRAGSEIRKYPSCFISYSSKDHDFASRLHADLQTHGVRCWFAPKDMPIGAKIRDALDDAIRDVGKVLLILSESSLASGWVEKEFETTFEEEQRRGELLLFPIRLDQTALSVDKAWVADIRRSRNIGDFSGWRNKDSYNASFDRLLLSLEKYGEAAR